MHCAGISRVNVAVQGLLSMGSVKPEVIVTLDWRDSEKCVTFVTKRVCKIILLCSLEKIQTNK